MRYIQTKHLQPGDKLASDLVLSKNRLMLRRGIPLTDALIRRVRINGFAGLYIDDDLSEGLYISDVVSERIKIKTAAELRALFESAQTGDTTRLGHQTKSLQKLAGSIVDEIRYEPQAMVNAVDLRTYDEYTYRHCLNVAVLSVVVGCVLGLTQSDLVNLALGALLHDVGRMFVDADVDRRPERLSPDKFEQVKRHCRLGFDFLSENVNIPESAVNVALYHHEHYDGSGYPSGLAFEDIPLFSRIVCATDVYDALTSDRPYRKAVLPSDAIEYIMSGYNTLFDPTVVKALTKKVAPYPVGTCVRLSSGDVGIVVKNCENTSLRPIIRLIRDDILTEDLLDLAGDRSALNVTIAQIIQL